MFLNLTKTTQRNYQFQLTATSLNHPGLVGQLQDKYTGINTTLDLNGTTSVNFTIDANVASQDPNRFMVVFGPLSVAPVTFSSVKASQQNNNISVQWNVANEINIKEYDVQRSEDGNNFRIDIYYLIGLNGFNYKIKQIKMIYRNFKILYNIYIL